MNNDNIYKVNTPLLDVENYVSRTYIGKHFKTTNPN